MVMECTRDFLTGRIGQNFILSSFLSKCQKQALKLPLIATQTFVLVTPWWQNVVTKDLWQATINLFFLVLVYVCNYIIKKVMGKSLVSCTNNHQFPVLMGRYSLISMLLKYLIHHYTSASHSPSLLAS